jgi:hypothetical protein
MGTIIMSCIIVNLMGGLGNQMSQYAFGKMIEFTTAIPVKFDMRYFSFKTREHEYELDKLSIPHIERATFFDTIKHRSPIPNQLNYTRAYVCEKTLAYDPNIITKLQELQDTKESAYFDGYWHNERYFEPVKNILRNEFIPKSEMPDENKEIAIQINIKNSVALHVRRGNYITNPNASNFIGALDISYYKNAIEYMDEHVQNPYYFVFSNDPVWAHDNLNLGDRATFITNNANAPQEDISLMSLCDHFIIANSSFSWWGAWLSHRSDKIVLTPDPWFRNEKANSEFEIPKRWLKIRSV